MTKTINAMCIMLTVFTDDGDELDLELPAKWEICGGCRGNGAHSRGVECDGGGITMSEMAEIEHDDPGFSEDYFAGRYDRGCEECGGSGKVKVIDFDSLDEETAKLVEQSMADDAAYAAESAAERAMGA